MENREGGRERRGEVDYLLIKRQDFGIKEFVNEPVAERERELRIVISFWEK